MPRNALTTLPQPIFNEGSVTPDPTKFKTKHPSDSKLYDQIQSLCRQLQPFAPAE
jgi:hypothetical protein